MGLFDGWEPPKDESGPKIVLAAPGDYFQGVVTKISDRYEGTYGPYFWINVELEAGSGTGVPTDGEAGYPVSVNRPNTDDAIGHVRDEIQKAVKRAGGTSLGVGDRLAVKYLEDVPVINKRTGKPYDKPFRKHAAIVEPASKDLFEKAPF